MDYGYDGKESKYKVQEEIIRLKHTYNFLHEVKHGSSLTSFLVNKHQNHLFILLSVTLNLLYHHEFILYKNRKIG